VLVLPLLGTILKALGLCIRTNHTLPTNGYATLYSGVNLNSFMLNDFSEDHRGIQNIGPCLNYTSLKLTTASTSKKNAVTLRLKGIKDGK
jgi:histidinol dehydrogenase